MKTKVALLNLVFGFAVSVMALGVLHLNGSVRAQLPTKNNRNLSQNTSNAVSMADFTAAADLAIPAVVHIRTTFTRKNAYYDDFFSPFYDFFNMQSPFGNQPIIGAGSGVIVNAEGYIVTNNHVVSDADKITVTLNDKREYEAAVVGLDPTTDLALIKIDEKNLPYLVFGNSDNVRIGEWVLAVGNPFNLTSTVTAGIISAKARSINILGGGSSVESFLQTDAAVNPGNSGGALVNTSGELIGINAAIASNTGSYSGYSFAIPANLARKVVGDLMQYGMVQRAFLGADLLEVNAESAKKYNLSEMKGVYINSVNVGGAAENAGIQVGDVILEIDGQEVNSSSRLLEIIAEQHPGDEIVVDIDRNGKKLTKTVTLLNRKGETDMLKKGDREVLTALGATFEEPSAEEMSSLRLKNGLKVVELQDGVLLRAGIKSGFIITKIDDKEIITIQDIESALGNKTGGVLIEGVYPNGMKAYYGFGM